MSLPLNKRLEPTRLTQLSTVKARLALTVTDYDGILPNAIKAVSTVSTKNQPHLSRTENATSHQPLIS